MEKKQSHKFEKWFFVSLSSTGNRLAENVPFKIAKEKAKEEKEPFFGLIKQQIQNYLCFHSKQNAR